MQESRKAPRFYIIYPEGFIDAFYSDGPFSYGFFKSIDEGLEITVIDTWHNAQYWHSGNWIELGEVNIKDRVNYPDPPTEYIENINHMMPHIPLVHEGGNMKLDELNRGCEKAINNARKYPGGLYCLLAKDIAHYEYLWHKVLVAKIPEEEVEKRRKGSKIVYLKNGSRVSVRIEEHHYTWATEGSYAGIVDVQDNYTEITSDKAQADYYQEYLTSHEITYD